MSKPFRHGQQNTHSSVNYPIQIWQSHQGLCEEGCATITSAERQFLKLAGLHTNFTEQLITERQRFCSQGHLLALCSSYWTLAWAIFLSTASWDSWTILSWPLSSLVTSWNCDSLPIASYKKVFLCPARFQSSHPRFHFFDTHTHKLMEHSEINEWILGS